MIDASRARENDLGRSNLEPYDFKDALGLGEFAGVASAAVVGEFECRRVRDFGGQVTKGAWGMSWR